MKRKQKSGFNAVDLILKVFQGVRDTAPKHLLVLVDKQDVAILLRSGPNEGQSARLCRTGNEISIEFYLHPEVAINLSPSNLACLKLTLGFKHTGVSDPFLGNLHEIKLSTRDDMNDLLMLTERRRKLIGHFREFIDLIPRLKCHHMWDSEIEATWDAAGPNSKKHPDAEFVQH